MEFKLNNHLLLCCALIVLNTLTTFFMSESQRRFTVPTYLYIFLSEVVKLLFSVVVYLSSPDPVDAKSQSVVSTFAKLLDQCISSYSLPFSVPALLYFLQNNCAIYALYLLPKSLYQALTQLKLPATAVTSWLVLNRTYSPIQWVGLVAVVWGEITTAESFNSTSTEFESVSILGVGLMMVVVSFSALSAVVSEKLLKRDPNENINKTNTYLYFYGVLFNGFGLFSERQPLGQLLTLDSEQLLLFFSAVALLSANGIFVSFIFKYISAVAKTISVAMTLILVQFFAYFFFNEILNTGDLIGVFLILFGVGLYNHKILFGEQEGGDKSSPK